MEARVRARSEFATLVAVEDIPSRQLRNNTASVLRHVASGQHLRILVGGQPVAVLGPLPTHSKPRFVAVARLAAAASGRPPDADFAARFTADLVALGGGTTDDMDDPWERSDAGTR